MTGAINRFCRNAPARVGSWLLMPFARLGNRDANSQRFDQAVQDAFDNGVVPIGLSAAVTGLFLILLLYLK